MDIKLIAARKSLEFPVDGLRLTAISTPDTLDAIRNLFRLQWVQIAQPMETFGLVAPVIPPGVVFNSGSWTDPIHGSVFVRFLHIEQTRIVRDIVGPSDVLVGLGEAVVKTIRDVARVFDDGPALTDPETALHYSEMTIQLPAPLSMILPLSLRQLWSQSIPDEANQLLSTALYTDRHIPDAPYGGDRLASPIKSQGYRLSLRKGINPAAHVYFSGAPLDTDVHRAYLMKVYEIVQQHMHP